MHPPTGEQYTLQYGDQQLVATELGAHIRSYCDGDRHVFIPFPLSQLPAASQGAVLLPWPNRLAGGHYHFGGTSYQLPITEPARFTALHGLASWQYWTVAELSETHICFTLRLAPSPGYPWELTSQLRYELSPFGLAVGIETRNESDTDAPYGVGFHPWLSPGGYRLDECSARIDAATRIVPNERLLPAGTMPVAGSCYDGRTHTTMTGKDWDDCFVDLIRDADGLAWVELAAPDSTTAAVWLDHSGAAFQVCSGDHLPDRAQLRCGLAAEPQTCAPDAFNSGERLVILSPGATHTMTWGARLKRN